MRLRAIQAVFILGLIAGMSLSATAPAQIASGSAPGSADLAAGPGTPATDLSQKNVLVLHALEANMPLNVQTDRAIIAALEAGGIGIRNQFFEYLDLQRNPGSEHRKRLADMMHLRYGERKIDVVITLYPEALKFLLMDCREIFPDGPIVALYMAPGVELPKTGHRIIQHVFRGDMQGTLEIALKLVPGAKHVYVVGGVHLLDKKNEAQARQDFKKWDGVLDFRYLSDTSLEEMLTAVSSAPLKSIIFYLAMTGDTTGKTYNPRDVAERVSQVSKHPVFGIYETLLEHGIVGGSIVSYGGIGTQAGKLALSMLGIGSTSDNPYEILDIPGVPMFDWRQLRQWDLDDDALPKGSIVINKESTLWDHRYYIVGVLAFFIAQAILIVALLVQRRRRRWAEQSLRQKKEELDKFFSMTLDLLCIANTDGYYLRLNPAWEKTLGYSLAELMSKRFLEFVHPDDVAATEVAVQALASQRQVVDFANRYRSRDGSYRQLLWSAAAVGNLIYAAARDITERLQAEAVIHEREKELQSLTGRLILGQEEERRHLARELHDDLSQRLAVLAIEAGKTETVVRDGHGSILKSLRGLRDQAIQISADVHSLSRRLHPSILDDLGLTKAVEAECARFSTREGIEVTFSAENIPGALSKDVSLSTYRIIQESLTNIAKHACARHVKVAMTGNGDSIGLTVQDDGIGFDAVEVKKKPGLGLSSIRERVRIIHGEHRITSEPEKGTTITVKIPLKKTSREEGSPNHPG
jgi:PAS domain S-box-containing protein